MESRWILESGGGLNRTNVELKRASEEARRTPSSGLNRTNVELKPFLRSRDGLLAWCLNRTNVELKRRW